MPWRKRKSNTEDDWEPVFRKLPPKPGQAEVFMYGPGQAAKLREQGKLPKQRQRKR